MASDSDIPINPLKAMRLSHSLTQQQVMDRAYIGQLVIIRNEQAVYPKPSPAYFNFLLDLTGETEATQLRRYYEFQLLTRKANYGELIADMNWTRYTRPISNPLTLWRQLSGLNPTEVAKLYCIHPVAIHKVEKQPHLANTIPSQILNALKMSGYSYELLGAFQRAYANYKDYQRTLVTSRWWDF